MVYKTAGNLELRSGTTDVKINLNGVDGSITAGGGSFQSSTTSSWFVTGTTLYSNNYVWAAKDLSGGGSGNWHSGLKTNGDLCLSDNSNNLSSPRIQLNGSSGNATFTGTVTAANITSDIRFKENIADANPQLADVVALGSQLKNWDWTDDAPLNDELRAKRFLGLVAQEAEKVCPDVAYSVPRTKQGAELTPEVVVPAVYETRTVPAVLDDEGEVVEAETTEQVLVTEEQVTPATYEELDDSYKAIKHDVLIMKLLGAVAELSAKVAALESA